jgi:hypothetical protein
MSCSVAAAVDATAQWLGVPPTVRLAIMPWSGTPTIGVSSCTVCSVWGVLSHCWSGRQIRGGDVITVDYGALTDLQTSMRETYEQIEQNLTSLSAQVPACQDRMRPAVRSKSA